MEREGNGVVDGEEAVGFSLSCAMCLVSASVLQGLQQQLSLLPFRGLAGAMVMVLGFLGGSWYLRRTLSPDACLQTVGGDTQPSRFLRLATFFLRRRPLTCQNTSWNLCLGLCPPRPSVVYVRRVCV